MGYNHLVKNILRKQKRQLKALQEPRPQQGSKNKRKPAKKSLHGVIAKDDQGLREALEQGQQQQQQQQPKVRVFLHGLMTSDDAAKMTEASHIVEEGGDFNRAVSLLSEVVTHNPNNIEPLFVRARAYAKSGQFDQAYSDLDLIISQHSNTQDPELKQKVADAYNLRGKIKATLGDNKGAIEEFSNASRFDPKSPHPYMNKATVYLTLPEGPDYSNALADFYAACKLGHRDPKIFFNMGSIIANVFNDSERAIEMYNFALQLDPDYADALHNRALAYADMHQFDEAVADYEACFALSPDSLAKNPDVRSNLVMALWSKGDTQAALDEANTILQMHPDHYQTLMNRALIYDTLGKTDEAVQELTSVIDTFTAKLNNSNSESDNNDPSSSSLLEHLVDALIYRGSMHSDRSEYDKAEADFTRAIEINADPRETRAYNNRAVCYMRSQQYEKALADFTTCIEIDPEFPPHYSHRGVCLMSLNRLDEAIADQNTAINLDNNYDFAYNYRGLAYWEKYLQLQQQEEGEETTKQQQENSKKLLEAALKDFSQAIALNENFEDAYENRSRVFKIGFKDHVNANRDMQYATSIRNGKPRKPIPASAMKLPSGAKLQYKE